VADEHCFRAKENQVNDDHLERTGTALIRSDLRAHHRGDRRTSPAHHGAWLRAPRTAMLLLAAVLVAGVARAQPFEQWLQLAGHPSNGYVSVPDHPALDITGSFTFEAWVSISNSTGECASIAGKGYVQAWWIGVCTVGSQEVLRSYLKGGDSDRDGGVIPRGVLTHVAVVFNGTQRLHYINGEVAAAFPESGPLRTSNAPLRIGSDVDYNYSPAGLIDEVRLWNVARTTQQIRAGLNVRLPRQPGLVALWALDGNGDDLPGSVRHDGTVQGAGVSFPFSAVGLACAPGNPLELCLGNRFLITARWRTNATPGTPTDGDGRVALAGPGSGIFWFFSPDNWEVMVKALDACALNDRHWVFSAATTNVFYRLQVRDLMTAEQKIYFNYPGPPAPAVTDTAGLGGCP
jgi:hypothetical protein